MVMNEKVVRFLGKNRGGTRQLPLLVTPTLVTPLRSTTNQPEPCRQASCSRVGQLSGDQEGSTGDYRQFD